MFSLTISTLIQQHHFLCNLVLSDSSSCGHHFRPALVWPLSLGGFTPALFSPVEQTLQCLPPVGVVCLDWLEWQTRTGPDHTTTLWSALKGWSQIPVKWTLEWLIFDVNTIWTSHRGVLLYVWQRTWTGTQIFHRGDNHIKRTSSCLWLLTETPVCNVNHRTVG